MENQDHSHAAPVYEPQEIAGRTVVISGGTTGIGRATARLLAVHGARVLIFGRHAEELNEALEEIRPEGIKVTLVEPGKVATDMVDMSKRKKEKKEKELEMLRPEDIAACVYFCLIQPKRCDVVVMQVRPHLQTI